MQHRRRRRPGAEALGILAALALGGTSPAAAGEPGATGAAAEPGAAGFDAFYARFRDAVVRGDAAAVAGLTRVPFLYEGAPRDRAEVARIVPALFPAAVRTCFGGTRPAAEEDGFVVSCPPYLFYFAHGGAQGWAFVEFAADPESAASD